MSEPFDHPVKQVYFLFLIMELDELRFLEVEVLLVKRYSLNYVLQFFIEWCGHFLAAQHVLLVNYFSGFFWKSPVVFGAPFFLAVVQHLLYLFRRDFVLFVICFGVSSGKFNSMFVLLFQKLLVVIEALI